MPSNRTSGGASPRSRVIRLAWPLPWSESPMRSRFSGEALFSSSRRASARLRNSCLMVSPEAG